MSTGSSHGYVVPPRYWNWAANPRVLRVLLWLVALGAGAHHLDHARRWNADPPDLAGPLRRPDPGGQGYTQIDFGGQWVMGRMLVTGRGRDLYHRQRQWEVVRAGYPEADESPAQRDESVLPKHLRRHAPTDDNLAHDADRMMYWFMGRDPAAWKTVGGAVAAPLAADPTGDPLAALALQRAAAGAVTPAVAAEVEAPAVGGPLYPPVHAFLYAPLGLFDHPRDAFAAFQVVALGLAYLAGLGVSVLTRGRLWWSAASIAVLFYPGYQSSLDLGQNPVLSLCLVVWGWVLAARNRDWLGGAVWGVFAFKPVWGMALFLVPLLMGRWRFCVAMVGTGAGLAALTLPVVGLRTWFEWLEVGKEAAALYNRNLNWINLSRDLHGIPRRFLHDFTLPEEDRETPFANAVAWGLWGLVFGTTALVYWLRADRRRPLGLGAAFLFCGAFLTCYRFMYYDVLLSVMAVACLVAEPGRLFRTGVFDLNVAPQTPDAGRELTRPVPRSDPFGPKRVGYVNSFPLTILAGLYLLDNVLTGRVVEATVGYAPWAGVTTAADGATAYFTPRLRADTSLQYPWDTVLVLLLWAWCGVRLILGGGRVKEA